MRGPENFTPDRPATWPAAWFGTLPAQPNQAPVAVVPGQVVAVASQVPALVLQGGASEDADGDSLSYAWTQVSGPGVALQGAGAPDASLTEKQPCMVLAALSLSRFC